MSDRLPGLHAHQQATVIQPNSMLFNPGNKQVEQIEDPVDLYLNMLLLSKLEARELMIRRDGPVLDNLKCTK